MADYADNALSTSRQERSAPWKRRASSDSSVDSPEIPRATTDATPAAVAPDADAGIAARDALVAASAAISAANADANSSAHAAEHAVAHSAAHSTAHSADPAQADPDAPVRQGTLSGFEMPEHDAASDDETNGMWTRRAARTKNASAPLNPDAAHAPESGDTEPQRVEPTLFATSTESPQFAKAVETPTPASRIDTPRAAPADPLRLAAGSARRITWTLAAATAALIATLGFGIAQSMRFDSFANESRAETARLEQLVLSQQSALDGLTQRLAAQQAAQAAQAAAAAPAAPAAEEAPAPARPRPARAKPAAEPAPKHRAAARAATAAHPAHAHHAQKPAH